MEFWREKLRCPRHAYEAVFLVAGVIHVGGPVHLVIALRGEDAAVAARRAHLANEPFEALAHLVGGW